MTEEIIIAGFGGQGVLSMGKIIAYSGLMQGLEVSWMPSYGPEIRGGTANVTVILSDSPISSPILQKFSTAIILNQQSMDKFEQSVMPGGVLMYTPSTITRKPVRDDIKVYAIPAIEAAARMNATKVANMFLLGAFMKIRPILKMEYVLEGIKHSVSERNWKYIPMNEVSNDKKKINVHELGFSESMTLNDVLHMLPELLSRPSEWQYENYSVEVNGIEVGDARDAVLDQLRLSDIQYIEVSENPITSYQNNGEGGTISIELANLEEDGKVKGSVSLIGGYQSDFSPNLNIGYKKNKFSIKALAIAEFFSPNNITKNIDNKTTNEHKSNSTDSKFATETAFGPLLQGRKELAHCPDEFIYVDDLILSSKIYAAAIAELCDN